MKPTELLKYLIERLKENGIIAYNKEFLDYIGIEADSKHIKRLSDYLRRSGSIRDMTFLKKIEKKFELHTNIWKVCESSQIQRTQEAIERALILQKLPNKDALNISTIIQSEYCISEVQKKLLAHFQGLLTQESIEKTIDDFLVQGILDKKIENQEFLVALLHIAYNKGLYSIIIEFILPSLYVNYRKRTEVQKIEAHSLGSLEGYEEAKHILHLLIHHNTIENINLRTSALSNHKRELLSSKKPIKKDELYLLIQGYQELHAINGIYSYYTGINLLYMVVLGKISFPKDERFTFIDTKKIYNQSKHSLKNDKTHNDYYANMSDLEFRLLLGHQGVLERIESFLANGEPHISLVERSLRQMEIFASNTTKRNDPVVSLFQKAIGILSGYIKTSVCN